MDLQLHDKCKPVGENDHVADDDADVNCHLCKCRSQGTHQWWWCQAMVGRAVVSKEETNKMIKTDNDNDDVKMIKMMIK